MDLLGRKRQEREFHDGLAEVRAFRDVGETFNYLGVTMLVTGHFFYTPLGAVPCIHADYVDGQGRVRHQRFMRAELPVLRAQNKEALQ